LPLSFFITLYSSLFWSRFWIYAAKDQAGRKKSQHMKNMYLRKEKAGLLAVAKSLKWSKIEVKNYTFSIAAG
jgi:hypothetical protein